MNAFNASGPAAHIPAMPSSRRDTYVDPIDKRWSAWLPAKVPGMHCKGLSDTLLYLVVPQKFLDPWGFVDGSWKRPPHTDFFFFQMSISLCQIPIWWFASGAEGVRNGYLWWLRGPSSCQGCPNSGCRWWQCWTLVHCGWRWKGKKHWAVHQSWC